MTDFMGAGLTSISGIPGSNRSAQRLNLHMNRLESMEGLQYFVDLQELILSANSIQEIQHIHALRGLKLLDLSGNRLRRLSGLAGLVALEELQVACNRLETLEGLQQLWGSHYCLRALDLSKNAVRAVPQLLFLCGCTALLDLRLQEGTAMPSRDSRDGPRDNPVCAEPVYRDAVLQAAPWLRSLDDRDVEPGELPSAPGRHDLAPSAQQAATPEDWVSPGPLQELTDCVASMVQALEAPAAPPGVPEQGEGWRLEQDLAAEVVAMRSQAQSAMRRVEEQRQENSRDARLWADMVDIATEVRRREELHTQTEHELEDVSRLLAAARADCFDLASLARAEAEEEQRAASALTVERGEEAKALQEEQEAQSRLASCEAASGGDAAGACLDAGVLQRELASTSAALEAARRRLEQLQQQAADHASRCAAAEAEVQEEESLCHELRVERRRHDADALSWVREAAEEAACNASLVSLGAKKELQQQLAADKELAQAARSREAIDHLASETARSEEQLLAADLLRELRAAASEELEETRLADRMHEESSRRQELAELGLQQALTDAREEARGSKAGLDAAEEKLVQQRMAATLADDQDSLGEYVLAEMSLRLEACRRETACKMEEAHEALAEAIEEEEQARRQLVAAAFSQEQLAEVEESFVSEFVPCTEHQKSLDEHTVITEAACELRRWEEELRSKLQEEQAQQGERHGILNAMEDRATRARAEQFQLEDYIKVKECMEEHAVAQIEQLSAAMSRETQNQKTRDREWHARIQRAVYAAEELGLKGGQLDDANEASQEQVEKLQRQESILGEAVGIARGHLDQLQDAQVARERRLREQEQQIWDESAHILDEASAAMTEMEDRFREECVFQARRQGDLDAELRAANQQLKSAPLALSDAQRRVEGARTASSARAGALVASLRG